MTNKLKLIVTSILFATISASINASEQQSWIDLGIMQGVPAHVDKQVNNRNWIWHPYNRWSFQNVNKILPTTEVTTSHGVTLPRGDNADLLSLTIERSEGRPSTIEALLDEHNSDAFIVLHNGKIVSEHYWNGMEPQSSHWIASMTKSFIGLAAEMLIDEGIIQRDAKAEHYVDALKGTAIGSATIEQLLNMTAGTDWDESMDALKNESSFARQYGNAAGTWPMGTPSNGVFSILPNIEMNRPHGEIFTYNAPQADAIGWVIASATGERIEDVISRLFVKSMGAEDRVYMMSDTSTYAWATGGLNLSARDLAKFGQLIVNKGTLNGKQIFSKEVFQQIANGDVTKFAGTPYDSRIPGGAYSSYFWITNDEDNSLMAKGMFAQYLYMNPEKNIVIARLASPEISSKPDYDLDMLSVFNKISTHLDSK